MDLHDQMQSDWSRYCSNQTPAELQTRPNHRFLQGEINYSSVKPESDSGVYCSIWRDEEPLKVQKGNSYSFAMDARRRLDNLKSGCKSALDRPLNHFNCHKDVLDSEEKEEESALDLVELIDVEDDVEDEESWLYTSPKKQASVENNDSALRWCRQVLDNPSPEMEAACCVLRNRLDGRSNSLFYRRPADSHRTSTAPVGTSANATLTNSGSLDHELSMNSDSMNTSYRLQDMMDVHIMARLQEASLRQDYVSLPADSPVVLPSYVDRTNKTVDDVTPGSKTKSSSSSCWQQSRASLIPSPNQSPASVAQQGCQSPKLARLHQQVTQFKLLKLAQNQATSRTRSPMGTSLRSLQAVRNSRSLETDDWQPADPTDYSPPVGVSSTREGSRCRSPSLSASFRTPTGLLQSVRDSSLRTAAIKRLHRSQSLSPCRIPHLAKAHLSLHGRVFASSERSATVAWTRNSPSARW